jgi:hypothetical protein
MRTINTSWARKSHSSEVIAFFNWPPPFIPTMAPESTKKKNSVAFSLQANYTDWATATCWRNSVPTFADRGVSCGQRSGFLTVVNQFSRPEPLLFFQVAPHLSSQGLSGPCSRPTATQKIWQRRESNPGLLCLQPGSLTTRSQRRSPVVDSASTRNMYQESSWGR